MRRRGFTLLEIMLVVGLLALLAAFAIPNFVGAGEKAKIDMVKGAIGSNGTIGSSMDLYKFQIGTYPEDLKDLIEKPSDDDVAKKWSGPYLNNKEGLKDPWGHDFMYQFPGQKNEGGYDLWSVGPDGRDGTDDDIGNWSDDR
ncbi:MAG: type II secretion system protein GspG [Planctomycetota bacterium]|nr:MAG: type II secretion system protein GspG [Planctomycetota bacterium]